MSRQPLSVPTVQTSDPILQPIYSSGPAPLPNEQPIPVTQILASYRTHGGLNQPLKQKVWQHLTPAEQRRITQLTRQGGGASCP